MMPDEEKAVIPAEVMTPAAPKPEPVPPALPEASAPVDEADPDRWIKYLKIWMRNELELHRSGHSRETREELNP